MSDQLDKIILKYINAQSAFSIATCAENIPYCATCFYAFSESSDSLVFKSERRTRHIVEALINNQVAGTILPDKSDLGKIRGLQFSGVFQEPSGNLLDEAKKAYYSKYPFAAAFKGEIWVIELISVKFTDNTLGFGKKLQWNKTVVPPF